MPIKTPIILSGDTLETTAELPLKDGYDTKLSHTFLPQTFSASETEDDSESDEENLDPIDLDPNDTLEASKMKTEPSEDSESKFRGRPSSCVFVASLAASLTDDELSLSVSKHFQQWGELTLVKVLRDTSNRPYAFVQYTNDDDAKKALKEGQHSILDGRAIRCEKAKVNRTLYVATGDGKDISLKEIKESLYQFGEIEQIIGNNDSPYRKSNLNKAWFCQFAYRDDAIRAYANLRLSPEWIVEWAQNIEHPSEVMEKSVVESEVMIDKFSIFVGQLDDRVTKEKLDERFSRHGKISEVTLVLRPGNNFAFVKFVTEKAAAAAVERENHAVFLDKTMHVQYRELHHKRSRYPSSSSSSPRLSLAPPPVNLPYRRASTGSGFNVRQTSVPGLYQTVPRSNRSGRNYHINRSVSFSNETERGNSRFHTPIYGVPPSFQDQASAPDDDKEPSRLFTSNEENSPVSSPSNKTVNSAHGESKSLYSSSTVSGLENSTNDDTATNPTSGHGTANSKYHATRSFGNMPTGNPHLQMMRPPSSYYYYPLPTTKENFVYDQNQYMPYASYPYFFNESYIEFPQAAVGSAPSLQPAPYYMYYSVPPGSGFKDAKTGRVYEKFEPHIESDEMDY